MPVEMGLWRAEGGKLARLESTGVPLESELEDYIEQDPGLLGDPLLLIGRQVRTRHGGFIDLLGVDADGVVHVLELKRDRTPREVTAQLLDYASWVATLSHAEILEMWSDYRPGLAFETAFEEAFGTAPPEDLNEEQVLTIVAAEVDESTERIIRFLNDRFAVPINAVFFRHFRDRGVSYLARTWLVDHASAVDGSVPTRAARSKEPWNGTDWYVSFGELDGERDWEDARAYGFVSAGGGRWFSRTLASLRPGARVFVNIPKTGYVGVGVVTTPAVRFDHATVTVDGAPTRLAGLPLRGRYTHSPDGVDDDGTAEYAVGVEWIHTRPASEAVWRPGMFANQNSACRLRNRFTIDTVTDAFGLEESDAP